uniref:Fe_hyd_lg_C domain-containing protein n=1 Tax=Glossina austeni TaxID=7395 RepID=A0A1A9V0Z4_GLOAU
MNQWHECCGHINEVIKKLVKSKKDKCRFWPLRGAIPLRNAPYGRFGAIQFNLMFIGWELKLEQSYPCRITTIIKREGGSRKLQKVEISLHGSLACSGCITCAEGVLITQQRPAELLKVLNENCRPIKISQIKPVYGLTVENTSKYLCGYLRHLGGHVILNTKLVDDLALLECHEEFIQHFRSKYKEQPLALLTSYCPGWGYYAEKNGFAAPASLTISEEELTELRKTEINTERNTE